MRQVDLHVVQALRFCDVAAEHASYLGAAGAHLGAELHDCRSRAQARHARVVRIEAQMAASATPSVEKSQHDTDRAGEHEQRCGEEKGDGG